MSELRKEKEKDRESSGNRVETAGSCSTNVTFSAIWAARYKCFR